MVNINIRISWRMQGLDPEDHYHPNNPSNEGIVNKELFSETGSIGPMGDPIEKEIETIDEGNFLTNPPPSLVTMVPT